MSEENRPVLKAKKSTPKGSTSEDVAPTSLKSQRKKGKEAESKDVKQRLKESYDALVEAFEKWDSKGDKAEEASQLRDCLHAMHRVVSRIEIQMAYAERDNQGHSPMPTPKHRSAGKHK